MRHLLLILPILALLAGPIHAKGTRAIYQEIRASEAVDQGEALSAMMALAEQGFAPALDRVGYYHRHGIGTRKDLQEAHRWYVRAVAKGHPWSTASLARVEIELNLGRAAYHRLQLAVRDGKPGTRRLFATAHIDRKLGSKSDPERGRAMLEELSKHGDKEAARDLLLRINWKRLKVPASDQSVMQVVRAGLAGDPRFAEPALSYLSGFARPGVEALALRAKLVDVSGIRSRISTPERIRLAALKHPQGFWAKTEAILVDSRGDGFARGARTAFWINKNAWVRVLQKELRGLGYYNGKINGLMTKRTISAQNRFCRDVGIWAHCASGPLTGKTLRAVTEAIEIRKAGA